MTLLKLSVDAANSLISQLLHLREECAIFFAIFVSSMIVEILFVSCTCANTYLST